MMAVTHMQGGSADARVVHGDVQAGILAIGGTQQQVSLVDGQPMATPSMTVTLSADKRIVDGDLAAAFLDAFAKNISNPVKLLSV